MSNLLIWGTGVNASLNLGLFSYIECTKNNQIVGFVDNNEAKWGSQFHGYHIYAPHEVEAVDFDYICIWTMYTKEVYKQIVDDLKISGDRVKDIFMPYKQMIYDKYMNSEEPQIKTFLKKMEEDSILNNYYFDRANKEEIFYEAHYDEEADLHYIYFESKKMYFKRDYPNFVERDGKKYVGDVWWEQDLNSPHLYESGDIVVKQGDVLVDAGVCEGNFSLHNIDKVSKVYLIECDEEWMEALRYTFLPYKDKVVFCNKFLSDKNSETEIKLNDLVEESVNFIKMDIEGAEVAALNGADEVLESSKNIRCAICSYHRHGDEEKITAILKKHGFQTETSEGYMLFLYDPEVLIHPELRRGIVRGKSKETK